MKKKAVILLSGGLDSATVAGIASNEGFELYALSFNYGQRHGIELECSRKVAAFFNIKNHIIIDIPSDIFKSALIKNSGIAIPKSGIDPLEIPSTYVPARNILFLSYALAAAESFGASDIFIGANAVDYSGYPDCRPEFFRSFEKMANIGTKAAVEGKPFKIHIPLIDFKKSDIIKKGISLGIDYSITHSCYDPDPDGLACGKCDSCILRRNGFIDAGIKDPAEYI
jgi:7-cyano-7-deazaguanine synthase